MFKLVSLASLAFYFVCGVHCAATPRATTASINNTSVIGVYRLTGALVSVMTLTRSTQTYSDYNTRYLVSSPRAASAASTSDDNASDGETEFSG